MYLKLYLPIDVMVVMLHTCNTTFDRQVWKWVYGIASRRFDFIKWEKRNRNLPNHRIWCKVTIDGTDFRIGEPVPFNKKWKSPKAKGDSVKYEEVAVSRPSIAVISFGFTDLMLEANMISLYSGRNYDSFWIRMKWSKRMPGTGVKQNLFAINMILRMIRKIRRSRNYGHDRRRSTDDLSNGEFYKKDSETIRRSIKWHSMLLLH